MNLNGVFFKAQPGSSEGMAKLTMVSTDGHRLSKVELETEVQGIGKNTLSAIIHKKGVTEVKRLFDIDADVLEVGFAQGVILFRAGGTIFSVRQIEDNYPDYSRVIPQSSPVKVVVPRERLARAIRKNAILTSNKTYVIKLELTPGRLAVTTSNPDYGEGRDELDVEYTGDGMVVGFNYIYLLDVLGVVKGENVVFEMTDEFSPTVMTSPSEPGARLRRHADAHVTRRRAAPSRSLPRTFGTSSPFGWSRSRASTSSRGDNGQGKTNVLEAVFLLGRVAQPSRGPDAQPGPLWARARAWMHRRDRAARASSARSRCASRKEGKQVVHRREGGRPGCRRRSSTSTRCSSGPTISS